MPEIDVAYYFSVMCQSVAAIVFIGYAQIFPIWTLVYKPKRLGTLIDKQLIRLKWKAIFNEKGLEDTTPNKTQHKFFAAWLIVLFTTQYYACSTYSDFLLINIVGIGIPAFLLFFSLAASIRLIEKFFERFPEKIEVTTNYLNENWKIGVFLCSFCLTFASILIDVITYIWNSYPIQIGVKITKYFLKYAVIPYIAILLITALEIDRDNFSKFSERIHPKLADFSKQFYDGFD